MNASIRAVARRVPGLPRLYRYLMRRASANSAAAAAETEQRLATEQRLLSELAAAVEERDALELQLYVLRSDHQRAVAKNNVLNASLGAAEDRVSAALRLAEERAAEAMAANARADEERLQLNSKDITRHELSVMYAKLAGRLTLLSSEIERGRSGPNVPGDASRDLYLDLLEQSLTGLLFGDPPADPWTTGYDPEIRQIGRDWPSAALTMIGLARLRNLRMLTERVIRDGVPGDLLEAGVWRGGACIMMRGVLAAYGISDRTVWVADSFAGLPPPDPAVYPADAGDQHATYDVLRVSSEQVEENFRRYGLLDRQVRFLKGWFSETLVSAPIDRLAILRLDGDMFSSTMQTLEALYDKVTPGGYVIVDDYILDACRQAVDEFRSRRGICDDLSEVDGAAVFWRKS